MKYVVVAGISGAGKTTVLNALEDLGYHCVDNMPTSLLPSFSSIMDKNTDSVKKVAVGLDSRSAFDLRQFEKSVDAIKAAGHTVSIIFVDCSDKVIISAVFIIRSDTFGL